MCHGTSVLLHLCVCACVCVCVCVRGVCVCVCVRGYASDMLENCTVPFAHTGVRTSMRACSHTPYGLSMVWAKRDLKSA